MNKFLRAALLLALIAPSLSTPAQTLFSYGNKSVSREEFLKAYNKNNLNSPLTEKALREYLDLYIPFKLKVQAAYDLRLDTLSSQRAELQAFRNQLMQGFLSDPGSVSALVNEAFDRSQQDIRISHIFIAAPQDPVELSAHAAKQAAEAYKLLQEGKDFGEVAIKYSSDPSVKTNRGDIGYITVFSLPYELENLAYSTPLNKVSEPYRSKAGYHIFKRTAERKAVGKLQIAQILLAFSPDATDAAKQLIKQRADSIYQALQKGADFTTLVTNYSNDNFSYQQGGVLPEFGVGRFDAPFELAAFSLQKDGEISKPILTEFGYHIIKRMHATPVVSDRNNRAYMDDLQRQVQEDARMEVARTAFNQKVLKSIGYKKGNYNTAQLWAYTDSTLLNKPIPHNTSITPATVIFSFAKQQVTVKDWLAFRRSTGNVDRITSGRSQQQLMDYYLDLAAGEYYRNHLEEYNKDFAFQVKEFKDGNLLFEVMQRKVWDKASADSAGLKKYFNAHKDKYWWENSASAILFTAMHDTIAADLKSRIQSNFRNWRDVVDSYNGSVIADSGRFEVSQLPGIANVQPTAGIITPFLRNETDSSLTFAYIIKLFPQREQRNFEDARGYVINDYQQYLEAAWVADLRKKYPVAVNEAVFRSLVQK